jgi:hypothetical protein
VIRMMVPTHVSSVHGNEMERIILLKCCSASATVESNSSMVKRARLRKPAYASCESLVESPQVEVPALCRPHWLRKTQDGSRCCSVYVRASLLARARKSLVDSLRIFGIH